MNEKTHADNSEQDEAKCQLQDRAFVLKQFFRRYAPAIEKQERRQEQQKKYLRIKRHAETAGNTHDRA